uniref:Uncharacterized protein n=1 Tax=Physcomitrium patens TaxID=3218 RepID=A0A2K1IU50_PHYPA|nr:hypothetical protein PHYPA_024748 [Physcomitrium patens]
MMVFYCTLALVVHVVIPDNRILAPFSFGGMWNPIGKPR